MNKQFGTAYPRAAPAGQIIDANHPTQSAPVLTNVSAKVTPVTTSFSNPSSTNNPNSTQAPPVGNVGTTTATASVQNGVKTYTYNGNTYTQAQLDAIAAKATPNQRELLNKTYGTAYARAEPVFTGDANNKTTAGNTGVVSPNQGGSPTPGTGAPANTGTTPGGYTPPSVSTIDTQNAFESGYAQYIKAQEDVYGIETARQMQNYANQ